MHKQNFNSAIDDLVLDKTLKEVFGFEKFRIGQKEAITTLLRQGRLLCIQPTGHGKSLLYQLPTCLLEGITLVISPLLALMRDQIKHLNERFQIPAAAINTDQTEEENARAKQDALAGKIKVLFIAPEQLDHVDRFAFLLSLEIGLLVVDEAHCISTWGHDFRPSYRQIVTLLSALSAKRPNIKILGLTATADERVEEDIKKQLTFSGREAIVMRETMDRPNISLSVLTRHGWPDKLAACQELLLRTDGSGLIYCSTRENVELVAEFLTAQQINVAAYHAGFEPQDKQRLQKEFLADRYKALIATNALGMGIDKSNLRFIIHFDMPGSITAYYQEVGRSGRDGLPSQGFLLFDPADRQVQEYFIHSAIPSAEHFDQVLSSIEKAETPPNLTAIKRITGLHPTRVTIILAELSEQKFISKTSVGGVQVYQSLHKEQKPNLSRYENQEKVKTEELGKMLHYGRQKESCRMLILRDALGDHQATSCGRCDVCKPAPETKNDSHSIAAWLENRPYPIAPIALHKVSAGISLFDSKMRSPLFVRFMKGRNSVSSWEEMDQHLIELLLKQFSALAKNHKLGALASLPSKTWPAQSSLLQKLSKHFQLPIIEGLLTWKLTPKQRQGELLNNDQRHHNVHLQMEAHTHLPIPSGALVLVDDYIGSGNTLKEAARALRANKTLKNELIPFTIASVKWHLGKPGFS
jgi:ATP-dependent DNA helicase, RecQ family